MNQHNRLYEAIHRRDPEAAAAAATEHLHYVEEFTRELTRERQRMRLKMRA
jgi:DNA-binding FadR family transcriptional regulator